MTLERSPQSQLSSSNLQPGLLLNDWYGKRGQVNRPPVRLGVPAKLAQLVLSLLTLLVATLLIGRDAGVDGDSFDDLLYQKLGNC